MAGSKQLAKHQVKIGGISCSFCVSTIQKACSKLDGVEKVNVSLSHEEALIQYDPSKVEPWQIEEAIRSLGYVVRDPKQVRAFEEQEAELKRERSRFAASAGLTGVAAILMISRWLGFRQPWFVFPMIAAALGNILVVGYPILKMAYHALRRGILNQHVLMEFGAFGGLIGGFAGLFVPGFPIPDFLAVSVFITAYHILSGYVSLLVRTRSSQAVRKLLALQPPTARVIRDGGETVVKIEEVEKGELVRIRPGEGIPVDGVVVGGSSTVDESLVTGESMPVEKTAGSQVIGGSVNLTGTLRVEVTRLGEESFLQQVAHYIEEARALKPGILQLVDIVLRYYVPAVLTFGAVGFIIWSLGAWLVLGYPKLQRAVFAMLSAFVMGYPCALGMATPLAMIRGGGLAAERGILMRSSEAFSALKEVKKIVFDKTGTLTKGEPRVVEVKPLDGYTGKEVLRIAASAESVSEHPLARAVVEKASAEELTPSEIKEFMSFPGMGVKALLDGQELLVGSTKFAAEDYKESSDLHNRVREMEEEGETVVVVSYKGKTVGLIGIADTVKEDAVEAVRALRGGGLEPIMITGDNERTARAVAQRVGIEEVLAQVLPNQKAEQIRKLQEQGFRVAMVGDGINDAPALMQADVGIAIGAGTDIAMESADVIIIGERLSAVVDAYHIGKGSYNKTKQNLILAFSFNGIGVPASITGLVHPVWAMVAMILSVTTVFLNSFGGRLLPKPRLGLRETKELVLRVPSMHCENCISTILKAISDIEGVESVDGDLERKRVIVTYKMGSEVEEEIRRSIIEKGHIVS
ncbi:MAG: heavy metal translocating P-type ATPase [Candidatus Bathyarchaeia archaeon]